MGAETDAAAPKRTPLEGRSANHFDLAFTEFEFLLDFGQAYEQAGEPLVHTRIIMTPPSAKMLMAMLGDLVRQYEQTVAPIPGRKA